MGFFTNLKNAFKKDNNDNKKEDIKRYEKGLTKSRDGFV